MLMYQKAMFDHYYCIKSFCHLKTLEICFEKFFFFIKIMERKSMKDGYVLKMPVQEQSLTSS